MNHCEFYGFMTGFVVGVVGSNMNLPGFTKLYRF